MLNILIPLGGKSQFFGDSSYQFSKHLAEVRGKPMIQLVLEPFLAIPEPKKFIFVIDPEDSAKFHLGNILRLATDGNCQILVLHNHTQGAACSCLLAMDHINNEDELIIANGDQILDEPIKTVLDSFRARSLDCGVISFESLHPKWSYVRLDEQQRIVETAEKRPISKNAIAGFYYFKRGSSFVKAAMKSIEKDANVNGAYYVAPVINELVLENLNLGVYPIATSKYHSFYSPEKIKQYESLFHFPGVSKNTGEPHAD